MTCHLVKSASRLENRIDRSGAGQKPALFDLLSPRPYISPPDTGQFKISSKIVLFFRKFGMSMLGGLLAEHVMILTVFQLRIDSPADMVVDRKQVVSIWIGATKKGRHCLPLSVSGNFFTST